MWGAGGFLVLITSVDLPVYLLPEFSFLSIWPRDHAVGGGAGSRMHPFPDSFFAFPAEANKAFVPPPPPTLVQWVGYQSFLRGAH